MRIPKVIKERISQVELSEPILELWKDDEGIYYLVSENVLNQRIKKLNPAAELNFKVLKLDKKGKYIDIIFTDTFPMAIKDGKQVLHKRYEEIKFKAGLSIDLAILLLRNYKSETNKMAYGIFNGCVLYFSDNVDTAMKKITGE